VIEGGSAALVLCGGIDPGHRDAKVKHETFGERTLPLQGLAGWRGTFLDKAEENALGGEITAGAWIHHEQRGVMRQSGVHKQGGSIIDRRSCRFHQE